MAVPPSIDSCSGKVLLVDDPPENLFVLMSMLKEAGFSVISANNGQEALRKAISLQPDLILLEIMLPGMDGYEVCQRLKGTPQTAALPVIFISARQKKEDRLKAFSCGGVDYIGKPFWPEELIARVKAHICLRKSFQVVQQQKEALERDIAERQKNEQQLTQNQQQLAGQLRHPKVFAGIISQSERMYQIFRYVEALSCSSEPVLIQGESGVGKELIAKAVHEIGTPGGPWVAVNIAGFDDNHFSDTLFGHVKGAFTGADQVRAGVLEKAAGGTLFLDEIGDLGHSSQVKLLRLLQEKEYLPLGSDFPRKVEARILVATNVDLKQVTQQGKFRGDLYFRLSSHSIEVPPLRDRKEDIPLLLDHFLQQAALEQGKKKPRYPGELPILLRNYDFPGNIRELRALIFDAMSQHQSRMLSMASFATATGLTGARVAADKKAVTQDAIIFPENLPSLKTIPELLIKEALRRTDGNQSMAAKLLGVTPGALSLRLKKMTDS